MSNFLNYTIALPIVEEDGNDVLYLNDKILAVFKTLASLFHGMKLGALRSLAEDLASKLGITELSINIEDPLEDISTVDASIRKDYSMLKLALLEHFCKDRDNGVGFESLAWQYATIRRLQKAVNVKRELGI